jgi:hypothetical protein
MLESCNNYHMSTRPSGFGPLPGVDGNDQLERETVARFQSEIPNDRFIFRDERQSDKGIDCSLEALVDNGVTNLRSQVQLKGTAEDALNADGSFSKTVKTSNLNYLLNGPSPIYVIWLSTLNQMRYVWAREEARRFYLENPVWAEQESVTIRFSTTLDVAGWDDIHRRIIQEGRLHREQHDCLLKAGASEDVAFEINKETPSLRTPDKAYQFILSSGLAAVSAGYAKQVIQQSMILSLSQLSGSAVQLVLGYAHYILGHFFSARGHLGSAASDTHGLSDIDLHLLGSLKSTCDYQLGCIAYTEWEQQQQRIEAQAPEYFRRQIRLDRVRWSHMSTEDKEKRKLYLTELQRLSNAIETDSKSTLSMKLHAAIVRLHAECAEATSAWIHSVFAFLIRGRTNVPVFTTATIANHEAAVASIQDMYKKTESLLQRAIESKHPIHYAEALHLRLFFHVIYTTTSVLMHISLTKSRVAIPAQEFERTLSEIQALLGIYQQADDTEGAVRAMMLLANWYDINDKGQETILTASKVLQTARALGYARHITSAEQHINGQTTYRQILSRLSDPKDDSIERWAESTDDDLIAFAEIYQAVHFLPRDRIANMISSMKGLRRMCAERLNWCQHLELHEDLTHLDSQATRYAKPRDWTGFCSLYRHRTRTELPVVAAIDKFKTIFCSTCDRRSPKRCA